MSNYASLIKAKKNATTKAMSGKRELYSKQKSPASSTLGTNDDRNQERIAKKSKTTHGMTHHDAPNGITPTFKTPSVLVNNVTHHGVETSRVRGLEVPNDSTAVAPKNETCHGKTLRTQGGIVAKPKPPSLVNDITHQEVDSSRNGGLEVAKDTTAAALNDGTSHGKTFSYGQAGIASMSKPPSSETVAHQEVESTRKGGLEVAKDTTAAELKDETSHGKTFSYGQAGIASTSRPPSSETVAHQEVESTRKGGLNEATAVVSKNESSHGKTLSCDQAGVAATSKPPSVITHQAVEATRNGGLEVANDTAEAAAKNETSHGKTHQYKQKGASHEGRTEISKDSEAVANDAPEVELVQETTSPRVDDFDKMYALLVAFKGSHGHCHIIDNGKHHPNLSAWVTRVRSIYNEAQQPGYTGPRLTMKEIEALLSIGFSIKNEEAVWRSFYEELGQYNAKHGHCKVPRDQKLGHWVDYQRYQYHLMVEGKTTSMTSLRIREMNRMGMDWNYPPQKDASTTNSNGTLSGGVVSAPAATTTAMMNNRSVASKTGATLANVQAPNTTLSWNWNQEQHWDYMYGKLLEFKKEWSHCHVPKTNTSLRSWINYQQRDRANLPREKINKLQSIGFEWDQELSGWESHFQELVLLKDVSGSCRVPPEYKHPALRAWLATQRKQYKVVKALDGDVWTSLTPDRVNRLNSIGFNWNIQDDAWDRMYNRLCSYKKEKGHCDVKVIDNNGLASWLSDQRRMIHQSGQAPWDDVKSQRIRALQNLGVKSSL